MNKVEVTASYSRKINHALYGGGDYENSDHFCSMKVETEEDPSEVYEELHNACMDNVAQSIANEIVGFTEGTPPKRFLEILRAYRLDKIQLIDSITEKMDLVQRQTLEEFKKLKRAKNNEDKSN